MHANSLVILWVLFATPLLAAQGSTPQPASAAPKRVVVTKTTGFIAKDGNPALQEHLNETLGVVLTGTKGERLTGKLVEIEGKGTVLFVGKIPGDYRVGTIPGEGDLWVHLSSADAGFFEMAGPSAVPLLVAVADKKGGLLQDEALKGLARVGGEEGTAALTEIAAKHNDPAVRKRAAQLLEQMPKKPTP